MNFEESYNASDPNDMENEMNDYNDALAVAHSDDRGFNIIYRRFISPKTGKPKNKRIYIYTSTGAGCKIRDAETGNFYPNRVGSRDEDLFFKVILATGECTSSNGSSTLFFNSPQHYMTYLNCSLNPEVIANWEVKRNKRLSELKTEEKSKFDVTVVH